jgi:hypothetical protein
MAAYMARWRLVAPAAPSSSSRQPVGDRFRLRTVGRNDFSAGWHSRVDNNLTHPHPSPRSPPNPSLLPTTPVCLPRHTPFMASVSPPREFSYPDGYVFPAHRLSRTLHNPAREPVVLVACGSFSPVTYLHLRMFEMAKDYIRQSTNFEIVGGYLSPVSDQYKKPGLLAASHRCASTRLSYTFRLCLNSLTEYICANLQPNKPRRGSWSTGGKPSRATSALP